jgi:hypothetical protein
MPAAAPRPRGARTLFDLDAHADVCRVADERGELVANVTFDTFRKISGR